MSLFGRKAKKELETSAPETGLKPPKAIGLQALMDPTVTFVGSLHALGGIGYVLLGSGLLLVFAIVTLARDLISWLLPFSIALLLAGVAIVIVWQLLEYQVSMLKLRMIISLTEQMINKKLARDGSLDTAVMKAVVSDVLGEIWGLNVHLLPSQSETTSEK